MAFDDTFRRGEIPAWWKHTISKRYVRGWGVCPAHLRTPSLRSSQSGSKIKFCLIFRDSVLSACVYPCLTCGRDRVMVPLSPGQKGNSVIATRPGEQRLLSTKEKEKHLLNTTACTRGKASGQTPGAWWLLLLSSTQLDWPSLLFYIWGAEVWDEWPKVPWTMTCWDQGPAFDPLRGFPQYMAMSLWINHVVKYRRWSLRIVEP